MPRLVSQVAAGNIAMLAPLALRTRTALAGGDLSPGFFLSVTCAEGVREVTEAQVRNLTSDTFAGDYRLRQQMRACDQWPKTTVPSLPALGTQLPMLLLSGDLDPVTPPSRAEEVRREVPGAFHVVARNNGHPFGRLEGCGNLLIAQFIDAGTAAGLDAGCAAQLPAVPFVR